MTTAAPDSEPAQLPGLAADHPPRRSAALAPGAAALLVLINVLWAGSAVGGKAALAALGPCTLGFLRFGPASLLLWLLLRLRGPVRPIPRTDWGRIALYGAFGIALTYSLYYSGLRHTTATESTLLIASEPILIALAARLFLAERMRRTQWAGMFVGFAGVYLIVAQGLIFRATPSTWGNAAVALALCFECSASVLGKDLTARNSALAVLTAGLAVGAVMLLPPALWELARRPAAAAPLFAPPVWLGVAYVSLVSSFFCYGVWFRLLPRYDVSAMAGFLFIQPALGPLFGWLLRGERMQAWTAGGAALVVAGVWLVAAGGRTMQNAKCKVKSAR